MSKPVPPAPETSAIPPRPTEHPVLRALVRLLARQAAREVQSLENKEKCDG